jgi:hypothetical protein
MPGIVGGGVGGAWSISNVGRRSCVAMWVGEAMLFTGDGGCVRLAGQLRQRTYQWSSHSIFGNLMVCTAGGRVLFLRFGRRAVRTVSFWRRFESA